MTEQGLLRMPPYLNVFLAAKRSGAAVAALPVKDTIKVSTNGKETLQTLKRNELYRVQTPQILTWHSCGGLFPM